MQLEMNILKEPSQSQRDEYHIFLLLLILDLYRYVKPHMPIDMKAEMEQSRGLMGGAKKGRVGESGDVLNVQPVVVCKWPTDLNTTSNDTQ